MGKENWVNHGTVILFGDGGIDISGAPDAENRARLIASAPALLKALEEIINFAEDYPYDMAFESFAKTTAEAAISKLKGLQP